MRAVRLDFLFGSWKRVDIMLQSMMYITRHTLYLYVSLVLNDSQNDGLKESRLTELQTYNRYE